MDWLYLKHDETGGTAELPDEPGVLDWYAARGWSQTDRPETRPFVPPADGGQAARGDEFVTLVHPDTGGAHRFPDNPDAIEGARETGWRYPDEIKPATPKSSPKQPTSDAESVTDTSESEKA